jgi:outer membrane protein
MLRNSFVVVLLAVFALALPASHAHAASPSIGIVDVEKIMAVAKASKDLKSQLDVKKESFQKEFSEKEKQLKQTEDTLLKERDTLTPEEFAKKRRAYEEKVMETRKLFQKTRNSLDQGLATAMDELRKNIVQATADVASEKGFDVVLTRESVLIAAHTLDITDSVLAKLDAKITKITLTVQ